LRRRVLLCLPRASRSKNYTKDGWNRREAENKMIVSYSFEAQFGLAVA
jgi:hypothetical protein